MRMKTKTAELVKKLEKKGKIEERKFEIRTSMENWICEMKTRRLESRNDKKMVHI